MGSSWIRPSSMRQHCAFFSATFSWADVVSPDFHDLGPWPLVARWTPVLAGSPQNCQPRSLLLQMDSPSYVEKQSDERKPLQHCDRPFLKTVREGECPIFLRLNKTPLLIEPTQPQIHRIHNQPKRKH